MDSSWYQFPEAITKNQKITLITTLTRFYIIITRNSCINRKYQIHLFIHFKTSLLPDLIIIQTDPPTTISTSISILHNSISLGISITVWNSKFPNVPNFNLALIRSPVNCSQLYYLSISLFSSHKSVRITHCTITHQGGRGATTRRVRRLRR